MDRTAHLSGDGRRGLSAGKPLGEQGVGRHAPERALSSAFAVEAVEESPFDPDRFHGGQRRPGRRFFLPNPTKRPTGGPRLLSA